MQKSFVLATLGSSVRVLDVGFLGFSSGSQEWQELELSIFIFSVESTYVILLRENDPYQQQQPAKMIIFLQVNTFSSIHCSFFKGLRQIK